MNKMEQNENWRVENVSTSGGLEEGESISTCKGDVEMTLMQLRRLWKTLLNKNERSCFEERKLCRTKLVKFLESHLDNPCDRARYLALDLLCGAVPRLEDKTDILLQPLMYRVIQSLGENSSKDVQMKILHLLRAYSRRTNNLCSFMEMYLRSGLESGSDTIKVACLHGIAIIFDQDIGDKILSFLVARVANLLRKSRPSVFIAIYRALKRIHERVQNERFYNLLEPAGIESNEIYYSCLTFEETDPFLNSDLQDCSNLIAQYQKKMEHMDVEKAFGVVDIAYLSRISLTKDCQRATMVNSLVIALKRASWTETDMESHVLDLIKLVAGLLVHSNRPIQMSGLEILKEIVTRMGFHLAAHLGNLVDILRETLISSNVKIKSKTERVIHRLMRYIHPMTVIWELLQDWEIRHKEAVIRLISGQLKCFSYCDFDLVYLCATVGNEIEDLNPAIRCASRDCVTLLLGIMQSSPVPRTKAQAVCLLLQNTSLQRETLKSLGITNYDDFQGDFGSDSGDSTMLSTTSTVVSDSPMRFDIQFPNGGLVRQSNTIPSSASTVASNPAIRLNIQFPNEYPIPQSNTPSTTQSTSTVVPDSTIRTASNRLYKSNSSTYASSESTLSFAKRDSVVQDTEEGILSEENLIKLWMKGVTQDVFISSRPINSRGFPQSETSLFDAPTEHETTTTSFLDSSNLDSSFIGPPRDSSTPSPMGTRPEIRDPKSKAERTGSVIIQEPACDLSGGDTTYFPQVHVSTSLRSVSHVESWVQDNKLRTSVDDYENIGAGDWRSSNRPQVPIVESFVENGEGDFITNTAQYRIIHSSEESVMEKVSDPKSSNSSGCQVKVLDPKKYNFNILQVSTPNTMQCIQELDEYEDNGKLEVILPTEILIPAEPEETECLNDHLIKTSRADQSRRCFKSNTSSPDTNINSTYKNTRSTALKSNAKDPNLPRSTMEPSRNKLSHARSNALTISNKNCKIPARTAKFRDISTNESYKTLDGTFERYQNAIPSQKQLVSDESPPIGHPSDCAMTSSPKEEIDAPSSTKYQFIPNYYKLSFISSGNEEAEIRQEMSDEVLSNSEFEDDIEDSDGTIVEDVEGTIDESRAELTLVESCEIETSDESNNTPLKEGTIPNDGCPFSTGDNSQDIPPWKTGRVLPRTPVVISKQNKIETQEEDLKTKPVITVKISKSKKVSAVTTKDRKYSSPKQPKVIKHAKNEAEDILKQTIINKEPERLSAVSSFPDGGFSGCQWRRDLEYVAKASDCRWALEFGSMVENLKPFPSNEMAEFEMKKALGDFYGVEWKLKERAMEVVIRLAKYHQDNMFFHISKIVRAICNEVKSFRQLVSGKAVLTAGYLYEIMGKKLENKLRLVIGTFLAKLGNRTLSAYFVLIIRSLFKIVSASSSQKVALAFAQEGTNHPNKASREAAAQFLALLTETLGSNNSLSSPMASQMLKGAAVFVFDCSPLTRYCGKRMFQVFRNNPNFDKLKDQHLDISTLRNLTKVLELIETKGVTEEMLPINIIK